jgi:hypothetical protein
MRALVWMGWVLVAGCSSPAVTPSDDGGPSDVPRDAARADAPLIAEVDAPSPLDAPAPDVSEEPDATLSVDAPPDGGCEPETVDVPATRHPVDVIFVVDNSASMRPTIDILQSSMNGFASLLASRGLDYRIIVLSLAVRGSVVIGGGTRYGVCIPPPLAGDAACGAGERFFPVSIDIRSPQPLEQFLGTLGQTAGYLPTDVRGGPPWAHHLRAEAHQAIVIVTDDNSRFSADQFETFAGGTNPFNTSVLPPGVLDASWGSLFDGYSFHGIYGWGSDTDPGVTCTYPDGTRPAASGATYTALVSRTLGARDRICGGASAWGPFFDSLATSSHDHTPIRCTFDVPPPTSGATDPDAVNVTEAGGLVRNVATAGECGAEPGWYYEDVSRPSITLCPATCDTYRAGPTAVAVEHGCATEIR